ncbi:MAG TPA: RNA polymerase sigma factor [Gaiellales bacterium]|jgi:RNA polymerase sigma-70 factor (ECF subfamily)
MADIAADLETLYRNRSVAFRNALASPAGGYEEARDAVQEAFAIALRQRTDFRGEGPLDAWVFRIALRLARRQSPIPFSPLDVDELPEPALLDPARDPELADALRRLPARRRQVVFLRYFADLSYAAIAELAGISEGTVAATLAQAHDALRHELTPEEVPHEAC